MQQQMCSDRDSAGRSYQALRRIARALDVHSRKLYRECSLTSPQMLCLRTLKCEGRQILSALAARLHLGVSTTNGIIDRLEAKGLVQRSRSQQDQRKVFITITPDGEELLDKVPERTGDIYAQAFAQLSPEEQPAFASMLERLAGLLDPSGNIQPYHDLIPYPETSYQQDRPEGDPVALE
ncbi:MarR family transcriptional regulator [Chlorobaculum sp. 24CR]|uniref:MarR family winged helix-turn-helix transcriptional regulator n=1 Tax=Chlorobaculum sp. 24CR TaxID=2508878 RepID=UPI00100A4140|nr:MarR family transcriptional regulator [Chlorobaculum sp. 24CR]RXK85037.1 MarR family transcriptional regulator [Chlorobaculum sp. 24CR]